MPPSRPPRPPLPDMSPPVEPPQPLLPDASPSVPSSPAPVPSSPAPAASSAEPDRLARRRRWLRRGALAAEAAVLAVALGTLGVWCSVPDTAPLAGDNPSSTAFIDLRRAEAEAAGKPFQLHWQWRPLATISRYLRAAVIYAEDYNFFRHDGVDWDAIEHALSTNWNKGAISLGGSTITQQLAKNLYLSPRRSMLRKGREALIAFSLEDHLSKQRILELYLNVVEWGDGVFGAEAASRTWFHHGAQSLTPSEAVRLATALPNPRTRAPNVHDRELTRKRVRLIRLFRMQGLIDATQERTALDELGAPGERVLPDRAAEAAAIAADIAPPPPAPPSPSAPSAPGAPSSAAAAPPAAEAAGNPTAPAAAPPAEGPITRPDVDDTSRTSEPAPPAGEPPPPPAAEPPAPEAH